MIFSRFVDDCWKIVSWLFGDVFMIFSWFVHDLNVVTRSQPPPNLLCLFLMYWRFFIDFLSIFWVARGEAPKRGGEAMPRSQVKQFPFCFGFLIFSTTFHYSRFALRASRSCHYRFIKIPIFHRFLWVFLIFGGLDGPFGSLGLLNGGWATFGFDWGASKSFKNHWKHICFMIVSWFVSKIFKTTWTRYNSKQTYHFIYIRKKYMYIRLDFDWKSLEFIELHLNLH